MNIEKWKEKSHEEKTEEFMRVMTGYHESKPYVNPGPAINKLTNKIDEISKSSDELTKSIKNATWVAAIIGGLALVVSVINILK
jgi:uncharacterized protein YaaR (DUF327 family)